MTRIIVLILFALLIEVNAAEKSCHDTENLTALEAATLMLSPRLPVEEQSNEKYKCYATCLMEEIKITDGCSYQLEVGKEYVLSSTSNQHIAEAFVPCKDSMKGQERCDCGYSVYKCVIDYLDLLKENRTAAN